MATDYVKDPASILDFSFDWSDWLDNGETISLSVMEATTGLTIDSTTASLTSTTAWLSGGTSGRTYTLTNRITTNHVPARVDERSVTIRVTNR